MDSIKRAFNFQKHGLVKSCMSFWGTMILINILTNILFVSISGDSGIRMGLYIRDHGLTSFMGANLMPIIIFFIIYGILIYHEDFALALSFGVTRKDFYKSTILCNMSVTTIFAIIQGILTVVEKYTAKALGYNPVVEFGLFNTSTDNILFIILALFTFFLAILSIANLIGTLQYRFGYRFWIGFGVVLFILGNSFRLFSRIFSGLGMIFGNSAIFIIEFFTIITCYTLSYIIIRQANIRK